MFANRFSAFVDACVLASAIKRNLLLSLAEAGLFRIRWSVQILDETEAAIAEMTAKKGVADAAERASKARQAIERAFKDASVTGYEGLMAGIAANLSDANDAHVIAAAVKTRATVIVTDNIKHFPEEVLLPLDLDARTADSFIADTIDLDAGLAVAAIRQMRERFRKPERSAEDLLLDMEKYDLTETVDVLRAHKLSL